VERTRPTLPGDLVSGPKGMSYQVVSAAEIQRREVAAALARAQFRHAGIIALLVSAGPRARSKLAEPPTPSRGMSVAELQSTEQALDSFEHAVRHAVAEERAAAAQTAFNDQMAKLTLTIEQAPLRRSKAKPQVQASAASTANRPDSDLTERLDRALRVAASIAEPTLLDDLPRLTEHVTGKAATPATARHYLAEIEAQVTRAFREHEAREAVARRRREVELAYCDLADGDTDVAREAASFLEQVSRANNDSALSQLEGDLRDLRIRQTTLADRRFALDQATAVLQEMGYHVEADGTGAGGAIPLMASSARWPRHGLQIVFRTDRPGIHSSPVAFAGTDVRDDVAFEEATCTDIGRLRIELARRGVTTEMTHHVAPGTLSVQRRGRASTQKKAATPAAQERNR
jgi:hypothetical protein